MGTSYTAFKDHLELEKEMLNLGIQRYHAVTARLKEKGGESNTSYGSRLAKVFTIPLADAIHASMTSYSTKIPVAVYLLQDLDPHVAAVLTIKAVLNSISTKTPATSMFSTIGKAIENEIRFQEFNEEHPKFFEYMLETFKTKKVTSEAFKSDSIRRAFRKRGVQTAAWTPRDVILVGTFLLNHAVEVTGLVQKVVVAKKAKKREVFLEMTPQAQEWIQEHMLHTEVLHPDFLPCLAPPKDWTTLEDGGYYTPELQRRVPFVKTRTKASAEFIQDQDYSTSMQAVNAVQQTAWKINTDVLGVVREVWSKNLGLGIPFTEPIVIPSAPTLSQDKDSWTPDEAKAFANWKSEATAAYTRDKERVAKLVMLGKTLSLCKKFEGKDKFYFVYNCDFRGRQYCITSGLSPQGADFGKGLLTFAETMPVGEDGGRHLCIHGANTFGEDKLTYRDRVRWVQDEEQAPVLAATDPLSSESRTFWGNADKPYQFLAFCFEYVRYKESGYSQAFESCLPIAADGSCNGLQHFSAMLKDPIGAAATNLAPSNTPADIYQEVADVVLDTLRGRDSAMASRWVRSGVDRKLTKKPVMTLPYGSTLSSCINSVDDFMREYPERHEFTTALPQAALYISKTIWGSIGEVVVAAREAMAWFKTASYEVSNAGEMIIWTSPSGFVVCQDNRKYKTKRIETQLCGTTRITLKEDIPALDKKRQSNGLSPNFVHSMDAAHMVATINASTSKGVHSFAMIHDDYGTHAGNMEVFHKCIREEFVKQYDGVNVMQQFVDEVRQRTGVQLPDVPKSGSFDIKSVLDSAYFFG